VSPGPPTTSGPDPGSFRDRDGRVFYVDGAVYRALGARGLAEWRALASTTFFPRAMAAGKVVASEETAAPAGELPGTAGGWEGFLRHQRLPFVSYPYEWCFGMLRDAALLQLELLAAALGEGFVLRDATPYNVQWRGAEPTFIDVGSFARLRAGEPWVAYRQFCELFLFPLLLTAYRKVPFQPLLRGALDGIPAETCARLLRARDRLRPGVLVDVVLHSRLAAANADARTSVRGELRAAGFDRRLIERNVARLRRIVERLSWQPARSTWSEYGEAPGYAAADREAKRRFVAEAVGSRPGGGTWRLAWDLGSNTGEYAALAAEKSELVVAMDADHLAVERLYRQLQGNEAHRRRILPLVVDVADPPPGLGWRGRERPPLDERGRPELVLCLALVHHLAIGRHLPVDELLDWLAATGEHLVVEHVDRSDPMVERLLRDKDVAYDDYARPYFERQLERRFAVLRSEPVGATRRLYFARARR
jgi:hypothetical protein